MVARTEETRRSRFSRSLYVGMMTTTRCESLMQLKPYGGGLLAGKANHYERPCDRCTGERRPSGRLPTVQPDRQVAIDDERMRIASWEDR